VNRPRDKFFSRAGLAGDEHGRIAAGDLGHTRQHRRQCWRAADNLLEHRRFVDFFPEGDILLV